MSFDRPSRGGAEHADAVERLGDAQDEQGRLRDAADDARGTPGEEVADARLSEAGERFAAREAWLVWLERGF
jgi:hypothetical protein